ncbi:MAG TPA: molybdopterin-guanine dinucleotide biosynthesis protein B [Phycisphaerae bacterium]|nr:molybdopterin-guanine dinucleotide biosynthesis protein B [Phycisphaerae bacterium]
MSTQRSNTETAHPPSAVVAVCGASGSGKTTLLEQAIPALVQAGLRVAVIKHCGHELEIDRAGKDSDRLFRAGAEVAVQCPGQIVLRRHATPMDDLPLLIARLAADHDVVLVEGHKSTPLPKLWLTGKDDAGVPSEALNVCAVLPWEGQRLPVFVEWVQRQLRGALSSRPVYAGILIGGSSSRMGRPKAFLPCEGTTLLDRIASRVRQRIPHAYLIGDGPVPQLDQPLARIPDAPDSSGPLAGVLAALRWAPSAAWLMLACDLPRLQTVALDWLLGQRAPGRWVVLPRLSPEGVEPLFALYEPQIRGVLDGYAARGITSLQELTRERAVHAPLIPSELRACWTDVDTPEQLDRLRDDDPPPRTGT